MANFTISKERFSDARNIIIQFLRDSGYDGSVEDGTGLADAVVKPNAILHSLFSQAIDKVYAYQSIAKAQELRKVIGEEEYDAAIDGLLANWFVTRKGGKPSTGAVRLWFTRPPDFLHYRDGQEVGTVTANEMSERIVVDGEQVFVESDYSCIFNTVNNRDEYYVDLVVRTLNNSDMVFDETSTTNTTAHDIYFIQSTVPGTFVPGILKESSEDFINRTRKATTTRELITERAINTVLMNEYDEIIRLYVSRHGSREQLRDIVVFEGARVHVGNKADIWVASELARQTCRVAVSDYGRIALEQLPKNVSIAGFVKANAVTASDENELEEGQELKLHISCDEKTHNAAGVLPDRLWVDGTYSGDIIALTLLCDNSIENMRDFVSSNTQRVVCYDPLMKHMFPLMMTFDLNIELFEKDDDKADDAIRKAVIGYIREVVREGGPYIASELVTHIHNDVENVKKVWLPISCTGKIYDPRQDDQRFLEFVIGNKFSVDEFLEVRHSAQMTDNTTQFYTDETMIAITRV